MLDDHNRELAEVTRADDFIVSDRIVGLMLAQASENPRLVEVFDELFSSEGNEIYLRPAELYLVPGAETSFYTVVAAAASAARRRSATGWRRSRGRGRLLRGAPQPEQGRTGDPRPR